MLRGRYKVIVQTAWSEKPVDALIALHARRSAPSIAAFAARSDRLAVVLTGTDLYRDLPQSAAAARSLDAAARIVVLQEDALLHLAPAWRAKTSVIFQSAPPLARHARARDRLDCVAVGHLREEKDPRTLFRAWALLPRDLPLFLRHIGAPLEEKLAQAARELARRDPRYRYAGPLPHGRTRAAIARAHVLVHPSIAEGGANVIVEAITAGTLVIASRISGNVGMLGPGYPGYFEPGDESGLAARLVQTLEEPGYRRELRAACVARRPLFSPARERAAIRALVASLVE
jgi:putative glycosyltransferase (TIGR04348 family)